MYSVVGQGTAPAVANSALAGLWNPHTTQSILVVQISVNNLSTASGTRFVALSRVTTRGTPASTVTPDIYSHHIQGVAPPSGALLDLGTYTVEPTQETPYDFGLGWPPVISAGAVFPIPGGIIVPPERGLGLIQLPASTFVGEVTFSWLEDWDEGSL
jgi:hypothetical protein